MTNVLLLLQWCAIAMFIAGAFMLFLRVRRWYQSRTWDDMVKVRDSIEEFPQTRFSLRRDK